VLLDFVCRINDDNGYIVTNGIILHLKVERSWLTLI
jgi:hypothetical protein